METAIGAKLVALSLLPTGRKKMIVEIKTEVMLVNFFEIQKAHGPGFLLKVSNESGPKTILVTTEQLELISKAIIEELKKAEG